MPDSKGVMCLIDSQAHTLVLFDFSQQPSWSGSIGMVVHQKSIGSRSSMLNNVKRTGFAIDLAWEISLPSLPMPPYQYWLSFSQKTHLKLHHIALICMYSLLLLNTDLVLAAHTCDPNMKSQWKRRSNRQMLRPKYTCLDYKSQIRTYNITRKKDTYIRNHLSFRIAAMEGSGRACCWPWENHAGSLCLGQ